MKSRTLVRIVPVILLLALSGTPGGTREATAGRGSDGPEISRSAGTENGVVILWPRIISADSKDLSQGMAAAVQARLQSLVREALPGHPIEVRPEPERVCGQAGCQAISVGALLLRQEGGCSVLALIGRPGRSATRIVPWTGVVKLSRSYAPFREAPENYVTVMDFGLCDEISADLSVGDDQIVAAIRDAAR